MSKKKQETAETTGIDQVNDTLTVMTQKVQTNQKLIFGISLVVIAIVIGVLCYVKYVREPGSLKQDNMIGDADLELALGNDSVALAMYQTISKDGYAAGNRANLNAAILLYKDGKYEEAINHLKDYSVKDKIVGAGAKSLLGDCYVNLDRYDEAVKAFKEAVKVSDSNPAFTPFFLMKLARVYRAQGDHAAEADVYQTIVTDYPNYDAQMGFNAQKLLERAQLEAEAK